MEKGIKRAEEIYQYKVMHGLLDESSSSSSDDSDSDDSSSRNNENVLRRALPGVRGKRRKSSVHKQVSGIRKRRGIYREDVMNDKIFPSHTDGEEPGH